MTVNTLKLGSAALDGVVNICLPFFTLLGYLLVSSQQHLEWALPVHLIAGACWFYSAYRAWKMANQVGIMITTIVAVMIVVGSLTKVWVL